MNKVVVVVQCCFQIPAWMEECGGSNIRWQKLSGDGWVVSAWERS